MRFLDRWLRPRVDTEKNILLTGVPRSGTTLACHLLNGLENCVALHEPMEVRDLIAEPDGQKRLQQIHTFLHSNRKLIQNKGRAISIHRDGKVPQNPVVESKDKSAPRKLDVSRGEIEITGDFSDESLLVIKHPAIFTALLPLLTSEFKVFAVIRNPISVLGSWMTVPFGMSEGHAPAAEGVDEKLRTGLADIDDVLQRQLYLLDWFFEQYRTHLAAENILKYEDVVASAGRALAVIAPNATDLNEVLKSRNKSKIYDADAMDRAGEALLATDGAYWDFYSKDDVRAVLDAASE
ncbi:MAG: ribosome-associated protein YbcJ (S4-like RNA binding protein) [Planctomycetota bacterium]|jgi:ribosome-associated protein YbcJ (S4-like RNA binding protein)